MPTPLNPQELAQAQQRFQGITGDELTSRYRQFQQYQQGGFRFTPGQRVYDPKTGEYLLQNEPITTASLRPVTPYTLPTPQTPTAAGNITSTTQSEFDQLKQLFADQQAAQKQTLSEADIERRKAYDKVLGLPEQQLQLEQSPEFLAKKELYTKYTNELDASNRRQLNEVRAIESNPNLTKEQAAVRVQEVNRKYGFEQADISLSKSVAERDYTNAQSMIDRKIQLMTEQARIQLDYTKTFYEENKDAFNKSEERQFQVLFKQYENQISQTKTNASNAYNFITKATENGMPVNLFNQAQKLITEGKFDEARNLASPYQQSPTAGLDLEIKRAQLESTRALTRQRLTGQGGQTFSIAEVDKYGLPRSLAGASERTIISQLQVPQIPDWFKQKAEQELRMSLLPDVLQKMWDDFRTKFLTGGGEIETGETESEIVNPFR